MSETNTKPAEPGLFAETFKAIDSPLGYLGSAENVEGLLRMAAFTVMEAEGDDQLKVLREQAAIVAAELLGEGKMLPIDGWNEAGAIDVFAKPYAGVDSTEPKEVLGALFMEMMDELADIAVTAATPGILREQWEWSVNATYEMYRNVAMGYHPWQSIGDDGTIETDSEVQESWEPSEEDGTPPALEPGERTRIQQEMLDRWEDYP